MTEAGPNPPEPGRDAPHHAAPIDLRARSGEPPDKDAKRFNIFLIDTGWNAEISKVVRVHLRMVADLQPHDSLYELTKPQSMEILKREPNLIGCDPTIIVYDIYGSNLDGKRRFRGFRLNLGLMRNAEQAIGRLQEFIRFLAMNRAAENLDREVRRELHREGVDGIVKLLRETTIEMLVE